MFKYLGSKRRLVPLLTALAVGSGARSAVDLFTGTTRVAQGFKAAGLATTAVDRTRASTILAQCFVETDGESVDSARLASLIAELDQRPGQHGYLTETFCEQARFFRPDNGARIDAIRAGIDDLGDDPLRPILLTALLLAADRVDSTTGVQMAYLKSWAPRASRRLTLDMPVLLPGAGRAVRGDAEDLVTTLGGFDVAYLDPPYNQHRYESNYHIWETIVANDEPEAYGVARKRVDLRDRDGKSAFNRRATMPGALRSVVDGVDAGVVIVSMSDDGWVASSDLVDWLSARGAVARIGVPQRRYVGATIGVHNPAGEKVGKAGRLHLVEHVIVAGSSIEVERALSSSESERDRLHATVEIVR